MTSEEVAQLQKYWAEGNGDQWEAKTSLGLLAHTDALRARLEEAESGAMKTLEELRACMRRLGAAERERDALKADLDDKQEVADLWMEKAMDLHSDLERIEKLTHNPGNRKPGNVLLMIRNVTRAAMPSPAEPLRTPKERIATVLEEMTQRTRDANEWVDRAEAELSEPLRTEGAPKQEECSGHCVCERHMLIINEKEAELRARVSRLEKKLQFIADCGFDEDIDWRAFARAALAPEAPVEKEGGA